MARQFKRGLCILAGACVWLTMMPPASLAEQEPTTRRLVVVRLAMTSRTGPTGTAVAWDDKSLAVGEQMELRLFAGAGANGGMWVGGGNPASAWASAEHWWRVLAEVTSIDGGKTTLDVSWSRVDSSNPAAVPQVTDRRTITLKLGQRHVLDYLGVSDPLSTTANVVLEVETPLEDSMGIESAVIRAREAFAETAAATLAYDVWLVHEMADGRQLTQHVAVGGQDSRMARFTFQPLGFALGASGAVDDLNGPVKVAIEGGVMGHVTSDGSLEMTLLSMRIVRCARGLTTHESGMKMFSAQPGETTAVDLPWSQGYCPVGPDVAAPVSPAPGVVITNQQRRVVFKEFFAGQRTSVLVTATVRR